MAHDNLIHLDEPQQVYILSIDFWHMFERRYHCDYVIQTRKYEKVADIIRPPLNVGKVWSVYKP